MSAQSSYLNKKGLTVKDLVILVFLLHYFSCLSLSAPFRLLQTLRLLSISRLGSPCSADLYIF